MTPVVCVNDKLMLRCSPQFACLLRTDTAFVPLLLHFVLKDFDDAVYVGMPVDTLTGMQC